MACDVWPEKMLRSTLESESEFANASDNSATLTKAAASLFTDSKSFLGWARTTTCCGSASKVWPRRLFVRSRWPWSRSCSCTGRRRWTFAACPTCRTSSRWLQLASNLSSFSRLVPLLFPGMAWEGTKFYPSCLWHGSCFSCHITSSYHLKLYCTSSVVKKTSAQETNSKRLFSKNLI